MTAALTFTSCGNCGFWKNDDAVDGLCKRHAPAARDQPFQVARWPETRGRDGCGEGESRADTGSKSSKSRLTCRTCLFWNRPGVGIDPAQRGDHLSAWWYEAGFCRRFAPRPGIDIGHHAYWSATHGDDFCFDGQSA